MQLWVIITAEGQGHYRDDKHSTFIREKDAVEFVGEIVAGSRHVMDDQVELKTIHKLDTTCNQLTKLQPALRDMKLVLEEVPQINPPGDYRKQ